MENEIQKGKMPSPDIFSNCKAFLLKSFISQENSFSIQKKKKKQTVLSLPFTLLMGVGEMYAKERGSSIAP